MSINEFTEAVKEKLSEYYGDDYEVTTCCVTKNNDSIRNGISIRKKGENVAPTIYLDEMYEMYEEDMEGDISFNDVTTKIIRIRSECRDSLDVDVDFFTDYNRLKDKLRIKLVSKERNLRLLHDVPHMDFADLSVLFYVAFSDDKIGNGSIMVRNEHMESWDVSLDRLYEDAKAASLRYEPPYLADLISVLKDCYLKNRMRTEEICPNLRDQLDAMKERRDTIFMLSNQSRMYGASAIMYPGMLEELGEYIEDDFYIIPSSIHEVLIVPKYACMNEKELTGMVREVNEAELSVEDILSDHSYRYHRDTHWMEPIEI